LDKSQNSVISLDAAAVNSHCDQQGCWSWQHDGPARR